MYFIPIAVGTTTTAALLDSGAGSSWINESLITPEMSIEEIKPLTPIGFATGIKGSSSTKIAHLSISIIGSPNRFRSTDPFYVLPSLRFNVILGIDWLEQHNVIIDFSAGNVVSSSFGIIPIIGQVNRGVLSSSTALESITAILSTPGKELADWEQSADFEDVEVDKEVSAAELATVPLEFHHFKDVFLKKKADRLPPFRQGIDIEITLEEGSQSKLKNSAAYQLSDKEKAVLDDYLNKNLAKGFIQPSKSPITSPAFFVAKKDTTDLRLVIDYKRINALTIRDRYAIPLISQILSAISIGKIFTKIDLRGAYNLLRVADGHEYKTAFVTPRGTYEYLVMPFGLCNAPSCFQRWINSIFQDIINVKVQVYLDDIIIFSQDRDSHQADIEEVLNRLRANGLYASPKKCEFYTKRLQYLGHIITPTSKEMCTDKLDAIQQWEPPRSKKGIERFLGFANYYRSFICGFSAITKPLTKLLCKDTMKEMGVTSDRQSFTLPKPALDAFNQLKIAFTTAPVLAHFKQDRATVIETDASNFAIGAILSQQHGDKWRPVAYLSCSFSPAEVNYDVHDKELLSIVEAFRAWRHYLFGLPNLTVKTDHKNLEAFNTTKEIFGRQIRWSQYLAQFDFKIVYTNAYMNGRCDALSRREELATEVLNQFPTSPQNLADALGPKARGRPRPQMYGQVLPQSAALQEGGDGVVARAVLANINNYSRYSLLEDDLTLEIKAAQLAMSKEDIKNLIKLNLATRVQAKDQSILVYKDCLYVPKVGDLRMRAIQRHHDRLEVGHPGTRKTLAILNRHYAWPNNSRDVIDYVKSCHDCLRAKPSRQAKLGPLRPLEAADGPWESVSMDRIVALPPSNGFTGIIVFVDRFSKMARFFPTTTNFDSKDLADLFIREIVYMYGTPKNIISDRGPEFAGKLWAEVCQKLNIDRKLSTAYHPETDGQTERINQILETFLRINCNYHQSNWSELLPAAQYCYNSMPHSATQFSPFHVLYNYQPAITDTHIAELRPNVNLLSSEQLRKEVKQNLIDAREAAEKQVNRHRLPLPDWKKGDEVMISSKPYRTTRPSQKLDVVFMGPFKIIEKISSHAYRVDLPSIMKIHDVFSVSVLRPVSITQYSRRGRDPPLPLEILGEKEWFVKEITKERGTGRQKQYLVQWEGYTGDAEFTWEPVENVEECEALDRYLAAKATTEQNSTAIENLSRLIGNLAKQSSKRHSLEGDSEDSDDEEAEPALKRKGQSRSEGLPGLFPWIRQDVLQLVIQDALEPEQLVRLRNPDSKVVAEEVVEDRPSRIGGIEVEYPTTLATKNTKFVKAVPNLYVFVQLWCTYVGIQCFYSDDPALGPALMQFLARIVDLNSKYVWEEGVALYIANTCRHRFGNADAKIWATDDQAAYNSHLDGNTREAKAAKVVQKEEKSKKKNTVFSQSGQSSSGSKGGGTGGPCFRYNAGQSCSNCQRPHVCQVCRGAHPMVNCPSFGGGDDDAKPKKKQKA